MPSVAVPLNFLARSTRYDEEKPFALRYNPKDGIQTHNLERVTIPEVKIQDIREVTPPVTFDDNGITICKLVSSMNYEDWYSDEKIKDVFFPELRDALANLFDTPHIQIFEYRVRRRSKNFPISTGNTLEWAQPVTAAHIDFNLDETTKLVYYHNGAKAEEFLRNHYQCVNIWKPIRGPVHDWPLALCDTKSLNADTELVVADVVYQDHVEENYQVHYQPTQRWLYLSEQQPEEMTVFRCADSRENELGPGVPHCAFDLCFEVPDHERRESIECRVLILRSNAVPVST